MLEEGRGNPPPPPLIGRGGGEGGGMQDKIWFLRFMARVLPDTDTGHYIPPHPLPAPPSPCLTFSIPPVYILTHKHSCSTVSTMLTIIYLFIMFSFTYLLCRCVKSHLPWLTFISANPYCPREYWIIYRVPGFLVVVWFGSTSAPPPPTEKERQLADGKGGRRWGGAKSYGDEKACSSSFNR
jgi:hypothetical protein